MAVIPRYVDAGSSGGDGTSQNTSGGVWPKENVLKARYLHGDIDDELLPAWEWLKDSPEMNDFFSWLGYDDLPWMVEA